MLVESGQIDGRFCPETNDSACARYNVTPRTESTFHDPASTRFRNLDPASNIIWEKDCRVNRVMLCNVFIN